MGTVFDDMGNIEDEPEFKEGYDADKRGITRFYCPYEGDFRKAFLWLSGWHERRIDGWMAQAAEEAELKKELLALLEKYK